MARTVCMIGVEPEELRWLRTLVTLLRDPDPSIPELARQALIYLGRSAEERRLEALRAADHAG